MILDIIFLRNMKCKQHVKNFPRLDRILCSIYTLGNIFKIVLDN